MISQICEIVSINFAVGFELEPDTPLLSSGIIDSLNLINFLLLLEQAYKIDISIEDIGYDNFDTAAQIATWIINYSGRESA
jgi:acyl carrier protein